MPRGLILTCTSCTSSAVAIMTGRGCRAGPVASNRRAGALPETWILPTTVLSTSSAMAVRCCGYALNTDTARAAQHGDDAREAGKFRDIAIKHKHTVHKLWCISCQGNNTCPPRLYFPPQNCSLHFFLVCIWSQVPCWMQANCCHHLQPVSSRHARRKHTPAGCKHTVALTYSLYLHQLQAVH